MTHIADMAQTSSQIENGLTIFQEMESSVRTYCRKFPACFTSAQNALLETADQGSYIDFLSCAGALNYGHNNPLLKEALIEYLQSDGVTTSLDMHTNAKARFLKSLRDKILRPRNLDYKIQFTGPTGTNSIEAALKIARKATGRSNIIAFTNGFHGMTLGSLSLTGNLSSRQSGGAPLINATRMPYCNYFGEGVDTVTYLEKMISDPAGGIDKPAAIILETVQGEGGLNVAGVKWLQDLAAFAKREDILLIVDEVQTGCGRTGSFFSFERAGIKPDLVCLSKSISGFGLPMALILLRPDIDQQAPGEHSGTFRGNNLAFITAEKTINFWSDPAFLAHLDRNIALITSKMHALYLLHRKHGITHRGIGMMQGLVMPTQEIATNVQNAMFDQGVIMETCGPRDEVIKLMPPLTIEHSLLEKGLNLLEANLALHL